MAYTRPRRLQLSIAVFLVSIAGVQYWFGWESVLAPWQQLSLQSLAVAVLLVLLSYVVRTLRIVAFFGVELRARFPAALKLTLVNNLCNNLVPTIGEISFPVLMQRYFAISPTRSLPALVWLRLLDLHAILLLALLTLMLGRYSWPVFAMSIALLSLPVPLIYRWLPRSLGYFEHKSSGALRDKLSGVRRALPTAWRPLLLSSCWTLVNWLLKLAVFAWIVQQFVSATFVQCLLGAIGGELTSILPVNSVAGVGTYEAGVVAALTPGDISHQDAIKAAVNLHLFLLSCTLLSGFMSYLLPGSRLHEASRLA